MASLIRRLLRLRKGYVRVHICGGSYERFLNLCKNHRIFLWNLYPAEKGYKVNLAIPDFFRLGPLAKKCRCRVRVCEKRGLPFFLNRHRKRKVFALGLCLCGVFIFFLSCFVWNISIKGNQSISRQTMMEYLKERHVCYGARKSSVDCRALAADLRNQFPIFTWVSVRMAGTNLSINVQENTDASDMEVPVYEDSDLVAQEDGKIVKMITRAGTPQVQEDDEIRKGDVLVLGRLEITDDNGEVTSCRYCAADADIYIETTLHYRDEFSLAHETIEYTGRKRWGIYAVLFGRYFGIDLGLSAFSEADVTGKERQMCVLQDFYLPVSFGVLSAREYRRSVQTYTKEEAESLSAAKLQKFLSENEEKGVQIFENDVKINVSATSCKAEGTLTVRKKTGRRVRTKKSDLPEEETAA